MSYPAVLLDGFTLCGAGSILVYQTGSRAVLLKDRFTACDYTLSLPLPAAFDQVWWVIHLLVSAMYGSGPIFIKVEQAHSRLCTLLKATVHNHFR